jgi:hypothetical protein
MKSEDLPLPKTQPVSKLWQSPPATLYRQLATVIDKSLQQRTAGNPVCVCFRADDIGVPGKRFTRLLQLFTRYQAPLALAVVPTWLTPQRWSVLAQLAGGSESLWCWHQHGWRHKNHELQLKKQEFGPSRTAEAIEEDLVRGKERLAGIMKKAWFPMFTPPWNRCSRETLALLKNLNFKAVSRFAGAQPESPGGLTEISLDIDLHTRKDVSASAGWRNLFFELSQGLVKDRCGIMIHHQRMNEAAFAFLEYLLKVLSRSNGCRFASMKEWVRD